MSILHDAIMYISELNPLNLKIKYQVRDLEYSII